ncbi:MAG: transcription factor S [Candidatus Asgardarchaeia archaeon]
MEYCSECGALLVPKRIKGKLKLVCPSCGYEKEVSSESVADYRIGEKIVHSPREETVVISEEISVLPTERVICPKCGYDEAYVLEIPTIDEEETSISLYYKCKRCGHSWREFSR